jgi:hypothetical protein
MDKFIGKFVQNELSKTFGNDQKFYFMVTN